MALLPDESLTSEPPAPSRGRRGIVVGMLVALALLIVCFAAGLISLRYQLLARRDRIDRIASQHRFTVRWGPSEQFGKLQLRFPTWNFPQFVQDYFQEIATILVVELEGDLPTEFFEDLKAFHQINDLHWLDTRHTTQVAGLIRQQRELWRLSLVGKGLRDVDLKNPALFDQLVDLGIDGLESEDLDGSFLNAVSGSAPRLDMLNLHHVNFSPEGWRAIGRFSNLEYLDLTGCKLTVGEARFLTHLSRLKRLVLDDMSLDSELGPILGSMSWLEQLSIRGTVISEDALCALAGCSSLKTLDTGGIRGNAKVLNGLRKCRRLRRVDLVWTGDFSATDIIGFNSLPDVTYLYFANIGDSEAGHLSNCKHLTGLDIQSHRLTLQGIGLLMRLPELRFLKLSGKEWGPELVEVLNESPALESVKMLGRSWESSEFDELKQKLRERARRQSH